MKKICGEVSSKLKNYYTNLEAPNCMRDDKQQELLGVILEKMVVGFDDKSKDLNVEFDKLSRGLIPRSKLSEFIEKSGGKQNAISFLERLKKKSVKERKLILGDFFSSDLDDIKFDKFKKTSLDKRTIDDYVDMLILYYKTEKVVPEAWKKTKYKSEFPTKTWLKKNYPSIIKKSLQHTLDDNLVDGWYKDQKILKKDSKKPKKSLIPKYMSDLDAFRYWWSEELLQQ